MYFLFYIYVYIFADIVRKKKYHSKSNKTSKFSLSWGLNANIYMYV